MHIPWTARALCKARIYRNRKMIDAVDIGLTWRISSNGEVGDPQHSQYGYKSELNVEQRHHMCHPAESDLRKRILHTREYFCLFKHRLWASQAYPLYVPV